MLRQASKDVRAVSKETGLQGDLSPCLRLLTFYPRLILPTRCIDQAAAGSRRKGHGGCRWSVVTAKPALIAGRTRSMAKKRKKKRKQKRKEKKRKKERKKENTVTLDTHYMNVDIVVAVVVVVLSLLSSSW